MRDFGRQKVDVVHVTSGTAPADGEVLVDTVLALLSALVLISNTMTTLVAEQTGEIGIMRAIGARRRQLALVYLKTALLLGAFGAVAGIALGIVLSSCSPGTSARRCSRPTSASAST